MNDDALQQNEAKIDVAGKSKSEVLDEVFEIMDVFCLEMDYERNYLSI